MVSVVKDMRVSEPVRGVPVAKHAYVFYHDSSNYCAVTQHEVREGKLGAGRVISMRGIGERFARMSGADEIVLLPDRVLASNRRMFAWTSKSRFAPMWFSINGRQWSHRVRWPNLLWIADKERRRLRVFALGRASRPTMESIVYHAPLMNIGGDGDLCEGSAQLPRRMNESRLEDIEACVYESNFTHVNHDGTLKGVPDNRGHLAFWRRKEATNEPVKVDEMIRKGLLKEVLR